MLKIGVVIFACFCIATVLTEAVGLGLLWSRGQLNQRTLREIEVVLTGADLLEEDTDDDTVQAKQASLDEIADRRAIAILGIEKRETLAKQLMADVSLFRDEVTAQQEQLLKDRETFETELQQVNEKITAESTELARGVLLASSPEDAVTRLMELTVEEDVILLRGMPEENIAKILTEFTNGVSQEKNKRAKLIYEALYRGEPAKSVVEEQLDRPQPVVADPAG